MPNFQWLTSCLYVLWGAKPLRAAYRYGAFSLLALASLLGSGMAQADMLVTVSSYEVTPYPAARGEAMEFTATATATGTVNNAVMTVALPSNVDFSAGTKPDFCTWSPASGARTALECIKASLSKGETWAVPFSGKAGDNPSVETSIASVRADGSDKHETEKNVEVIKAANLDLKKTGPSSASAGDIVSFALTVRNDGPDAAVNLRLDEALPKDFELESISGDGWSCVATTCSMASLSANDNTVVTVTGRITANGGTVTNNANVSMSSQSVRDPKLANNASKAVVNISPAVNLRAYKTMVSAARGGTTFTKGELVKMTLSATNTGVMEADGVVVEDAVPAGFTNITAADAATREACKVTDNAIRCNAGSVGGGNTSAVYAFSMNAPAEVDPDGSNTATVRNSSPTAGERKSATVTYTVVDDYARLTVGKVKGPSSPVKVGDLMTSTISVAYDTASTSAATGTITVVEELSANEIYVGLVGTDWSCTGVAEGAKGGVLTCTHELKSPLNKDKPNAPNLVIQTTVADVPGQDLWDVNNRACMGNTHSPQDSSDVTPSCASPLPGHKGTRKEADLSIAKSVSTSVLEDAVNTLTYTLTITNTGPDVAPSVKVSDTLDAFFNSTQGGGSTAVALGGSGGDGCSHDGGTINCSYTDFGVNATKVVTITLTRPFKSGTTISNTARVGSPDAFDPKTDNNSATVVSEVKPKTDVIVQSINGSPSMVPVGVKTTITTEIKNQGASTAEETVLYQLLQPAGQVERMVYIPGSAKIVGNNGSCEYVTFTDGPYVNGKGLRCEIGANGNFPSNTNYQLQFDVTPTYGSDGKGYPDSLDGPCAPQGTGNVCAAYQTEATIKTKTPESNESNNKAPGTVKVEAKIIDLAVTIQDPGFDPVGLGQDVVYTVTIENRDASRATGVRVRVMPPLASTPTGGLMGYLQSEDSTLICVPDGIGVMCQLNPALAQSILDAGQKRTLKLRFSTRAADESNPPAEVVTFSPVAVVWSYETGGEGSATENVKTAFPGDSVPGNNRESEATTVLPITDLTMLSKAVSKSPVMLNEPFVYTLSLKNQGPSAAKAVVITDTLPSGLQVLKGAYGGKDYVLEVQKGNSATTDYACTPTVANGATSISCTVNNVAKDVEVQVKLPVIARDGTYTSTDGFGVDRKNTAKVDVPRDSNGVPTSSLDPNTKDNEASVPVQIEKTKITGDVVYAEGDPLTATTWKAVPSVEVKLSGKDQWGNTITRTTTTGADGKFVFDNLPPSNAEGYSVVQTQPTGYWDYLEQGPAGVVLPDATCNGALNCASTPAANTIGKVVVTDASKTVSGLRFQELKAAEVKGWVYEDNNNDAKLDATENKIGAASTVELTGTAYNGLPLNTANFAGAALSIPSSASGYSFTNLPPSNGTGYTVKQTTLPEGYLNGKTSVQPTADAFNLAGEMAAAAGIYGNTIEKIVLYSAGVATGNNFGELKPASLSGYAFIDGNENAFRDGADTSGVTGMVVTITGTDDQGKAVSKTVKTGSSGRYEFADLRPGTYEVTITKISGMTHVGAQIGDKGGKANGVNGPSSVSGVEDATAITNITLLAGDKGLNYNFGQSGEGLSGKVYVDLNGNGQLDVGEPGIPGVTITLSGTTKDGVDVCSAISPQPCTTVTGADGGYSFVGLPESSDSGYTLKEQDKSVAPLSLYADGEETVGSLGGSKAVDDQISGIKLAGTFGSNYNFGEKGIDLPGRVFVDGNGNTTPETGEPGLPNVTITLSGTTGDGQDVCAVLALQSRSCTVQTGPDGTFNFPGLPAGNYTLTETQPKDYANSGNKPGTAGGSGSDEPNGDTKFTGIELTPGMPKVTEYLFAEKTGGLSGYVYHDKNGSGTRDASDPGIAGVTVSLTGTTAQGAPVTHTATTDVNGFYRFSGLLNGTYTVKEAQPANWLDGKTSKGQVMGSECVACQNGTSNEISSITLTADKVYTEFNFGEVKGTSISGTVYHDVNEDRQPNPHEGLAGVTVTLTGKDDQGNPVTKNTTTGPDGKYSFPDLRPSDSNGYTITETQPAGIGDFPSNGGQPGTVNGQPGGSSTKPNEITGVVLKSGESGEDYNFRDKASSLSGTVYRDDNDNGLHDSNEPGLPNVTVTLTSTSGPSVSQTVTTDDKGNYIFVGLPAGTYQVVETQPAGMLDGRETAGPNEKGDVKNDQFCDTAACNTISNIPLGQAENVTGYLFGERGGSLSGTVYADLNNSGTKDADEPGLAGVQVTLSGQTQDGQDICALRGAAFCTAMTDANGNYKFEGVPPGVYQLVKSQNQVNELFSGQYGDGKETAGVLGGLVENRYFGTQTGYNSIQKISLTADGITANAGNIGGYLFGVVPSKNTQNRIPPIVSGYVYMDHSHDRVRDPMNTDGQVGWTATLVASTGQQICQVLTTAEGFYQFDNLNCPEQYRTTGLPTSADLGGATFSILFSKDGNVLPSMTSSGDKVGDEGAGQITNLTLKNTDVLVEQNLPLDPEGVVYDAVTRKPVPGAVVGITFNGSGVFDPSKHLVGGTSFQNQTTGADGRYSFILQNDYPSGEYVLTIQSVPQAYLPGPSAMIPPCVNTLNVTMLPGGKPALMQGQRDAPGLSQTLHNPQACPVSTSGFAVDAPFAVSQQSTQYYLKFTISRGASSEILNNHIPLDPVLAGGAILVTKITPKVNVAKGDLVPYTITATNMSGGALANVRVRDMLPPGFRYRKGSATWNGLPVEPEVNGRELTWPNQSFVINEKKTYQLLLMVGAGVGEGEYVNQAWAINSQVNERISNVGSALVRVTPDPTFDCSDLIGKVFDDKNANGYQDQGEPGVPNVRVVTARGLLVTTDADGRFHVACAAIPQADRGSNFVMKLDERTLPSGYRMTTENPRDVRVTRGKMVKLNFGATVHKVVRLEVDGRAFADDGQQLSAQWNEQIAQLLTQLAERPTVLRIAYRMTGEGKDVAEQRLKALTERIQDGYAEQAQQKKQKEDDTPPLVIETESFEQNKAEGVR